MDQIPSFLEHDNPDFRIDDGGVFDDFGLRIGEVKEIIQPSDPRSVSKKFREYTVFVQRRANGTYVNQTYENCLLMNQFGSLADFVRYTVRVDPQYQEGDAATFTGPGLGARVLILCINGEMHNAVIMGGLPNAKDKSEQKDEKRGHHYEREFNGVNVAIEDDGSVKVLVRGKTDASGKVQKEIGTSISVDVEGNCTIDTPKATIKLGKDADEPAVLGNQLVSVLSDLLTAIKALTVPTAVGPSGTPLNAVQFEAVGQKLNSILSGFTFVKKDAS